MPSSPDRASESTDSPATTVQADHVEAAGSPRPELDFGDATSDIAPIGPVILPVAEPDPPPASARANRPPEEVEEEIRSLEERLDALLEERRALSGDTPSSRRTRRRPSGASHIERTWSDEALEQRVDEVDELGLDRGLDRKLEPLLAALATYYFRVRLEGVEHIPSDGAALLVANHGGAPLPLDGIVLKTAVRRHHPDHRALRWLVEDYLSHLPYVGTWMSKLGAVRASQSNAERLLRAGHAVAAFPEGTKGLGRLHRDRYQLRRFGRGGFVRLALRTGAPLIPTAIVGSEDVNPLLYRIDSVAPLFGLPFLPITRRFPALGPFGLLPFPSSWRIRFAPPLDLGSYGPSDEHDELLIADLTQRVRNSVQEMLVELREGRRKAWL